MMLHTLALRTSILLGLLATALPAAAVPDAAAGAHERQACTLCHGGKVAGQLASTGADPRERLCTSCHAVATRAESAPGFHGQGRCLTCHTFHDPATVTTAVGPLSLDDLAGVDRAHCAGCHVPGTALDALSEGHRDAGRLYHAQAAKLVDQAPSTPCLWCHSDTRGTDWQAIPASGKLAFSEHATHPFGIDVVPGRGAPVRRMRADLDPRIPLPGGRLECISCHQLTAATRDRLIPFPTAKGLCLGCHELNGAGGGAAVRIASLDAR